MVLMTGMFTYILVIQFGYIQPREGEAKKAGEEAVPMGLSITWFNYWVQFFISALFVLGLLSFSKMNSLFQANQDAFFQVQLNL